MHNEPPLTKCPLCQSEWFYTFHDSACETRECDTCEAKLEVEGSETRFVRALPNGHEALWLYRYGVHTVVQYVFPVEPNAHNWELGHFMFVLPYGIPLTFESDSLVKLAASALVSKMARSTSALFAA